MFISIFFNWIF